jgi:uncharacterized protein YbdZ (MbtH family)
MASWNPGPNPFPDVETKKITDFEYLDELKFVRHAKVHVRKTPESLWQLSANFRARMTVHPKKGTPFTQKIKAPRGLYTDLASVPKALWNIVGPIGKHLEASILHDYLYMAWTDFRPKALRRDWDFADEVLKAGMKASRVRAFQRGLVYATVHSEIGWRVFKKKSYSLKSRMNAWLPHLKAGHGRNG